MPGFPFMADCDKKVSLTGCQLIKHIFVGLFVLVDDLYYSRINIIDANMVLCRKPKELSKKDYPNWIKSKTYAIPGTVITNRNTLHNCRI